MDKRLNLGVLLVVLCWEFMPTYALTNGTVTTNSNATIKAPDTNMTTVTWANNATAAAPDTNMTTVRWVNNATAAASTNIKTTAAPNIIPAIVASISQQQCGISKHCVDKPPKCDPASGDCYFLSVKQQSGQMYNFELSGQTEGYIAAGLSTKANLNDSEIAYICANHNGQVRFLTGFFNNLVPNVTNKLNVTKMQGSVNSSKIQCTFTADLPDTQMRAANYALGIFTGSYNSSSGELGQPESKAQTTVIVLNSASFVHPVTHTHSFLPVLLATTCLLAFTDVHRA